MKLVFASLIFSTFMAGGAVLAQTAGLPNASSSAPEARHEIARGKLAAELRRGGYVIYFRHAATDFSRSDSGMKAYDDCANQRLLSEAGREQARRIGEQIRALRLATGEVLASPYCRTMETARLAFGQAQARTEIREKDAGDYAGLKRLLAAQLPAGANRWVVGHGTPFRAISGPPHLDEGEAAVIKPLGNGWRVVARVMPEDWAALAKNGE
ncbi:histidine phosphatase family protein [Noviherbaspirillum aerium]|uniref:histidine phosphatase family protein n=1 Tax=Noviherbaspirillum aerium TaxID=2588497 RepID=UPI00178C6FC0|nr:histidine phosphatase family protein [Noviherbaspirillum aerium]